MSRRKFLFFVNPISGTGNKAALVSSIELTMKNAGFPFSIAHTNASGNYSHLPQKITNEQITDVVICGGDGSISQIGSYLRGNPVRIGIIPRGSGNGLALSAGIPKNIKKAFNIILAGKAKPIDAFTINDKFSCMLCGLGFDAKIAHEFAKASSRGLKTYTRLTLQNWVLAKTFPFTISADGKTFSCNAYFISVANANQFGNNMRIAPGASLNDGLLDVVVVKKMNRVILPGNVLKQMMIGKPCTFEEAGMKNKTIGYFRTSFLKIKNEQLAPLHIDGEPSDTTLEFDIRIIPLALNLIQP